MPWQKFWRENTYALDCNSLIDLCYIDCYFLLLQQPVLLAHDVICSCMARQEILTGQALTCDLHTKVCYLFHIAWIHYSAQMHACMKQSIIDLPAYL